MSPNTWWLLMVVTENIKWRSSSHQITYFNNKCKKTEYNNELTALTANNLKNEHNNAHSYQNYRTY